MHNREAGQSQIWTCVLLAAAILFSFALACGMPFAALGAIATLTLPPRGAVFLTALGWLANQVIGFGFLGYPFDAMTLSWGVALGLSALAAVGAASFSLRLTRTSAPTVRLLLAFVAAWAGQQGTVLAASLVLGASASAFAPAVVWFIFWTNAMAFTVLLGTQMIGVRAGVARMPLDQSAG